MFDVRFDVEPGPRLSAVSATLWSTLVCWLGGTRVLLALHCCRHNHYPLPGQSPLPAPPSSAARLHTTVRFLNHYCRPRRHRHRRRRRRPRPASQAGGTLRCAPPTGRGCQSDQAPLCRPPAPPPPHSGIAKTRAGEARGQ